MDSMREKGIAPASLIGRAEADGILVCEVMVAGAVKGMSTGGDGGIAGATIAGKFWELEQTRTDTRAMVS